MHNQIVLVNVMYAISGNRGSGLANTTAYCVAGQSSVDRYDIHISPDSCTYYVNKRNQQTVCMLHLVSIHI